VQRGRNLGNSAKKRKLGRRGSKKAKKARWPRQVEGGVNRQRPMILVLVLKVVVYMGD
jgi:hypothetical protein